MSSIPDQQRPYLVQLNPTYSEYQLPISVKAVILWKGKIPLLKNERDEWELPGGKLEVGEDPARCVEREVVEELGWEISVDNPIHAWVYEIRPDRHVFVLTYFAVYGGDTPPEFSHEHKSLTLVDPVDVLALNMPSQYKDAISVALSADRING